ncbi:MAG: hypothetical protein HQK61_04035 [Desulfamplus sp.]|nr:hypothetical protein [Desulfamplus sp.]
MTDKNQDDDIFHPWHVTVFDQCGSEKYKENKNACEESDSFKVLYEQESTGESDEFRRIYGADEKTVTPLLDIDDEFRPFKTGITRFDERMVGKSAMIPLTARKKSAVNKLLDESLTEHDHMNLRDQGENGIFHSVDGTDRASERESKDTLSPDPATEVDLVFEEGYKKGFEQGRSEGYEDGLAKGTQEGLSKGMEDGLAKGMEEGYRAGHEKGEQEGYDAGFQKGEEDGKVVSDAKSLEIITSLEDIFQKMDQAWHNAVKTHESKILSLICRIAEKVVFAKVQLDEGIVKDSILNALSTMPEPEEIILNISADDYEYVEMIKEDFFERVKSLKSVSVISNPSVTRGGCKIESSKAKVETDIQTRLEQVFTSVMGARLS